jgi:Zn-finger nucleic acid-binding protein
MECPKCKSSTAVSAYRAHGGVRHEPLREQAHASGASYVECGSCGSVFLDKTSLATIAAAAKERKRTTDLALELHGRAFRFAKDRVNRVEPRCPRCDEEMFEREWKMGTMVMIDVCIACDGVWLDAGELEALEDLFATGR